MAGELGFVPHEPHIEEVAAVRRVRDEEHAGDALYKRNSGQRHHEKKHPKEYLHTISSAAERSNALLAQKGLPYRFRVFEEGNDVVIDLVLLNKKGAIVKELKRNIADEDFDRMIEDISTIEGLIIDRMG